MPWPEKTFAEILSQLDTLQKDLDALSGKQSDKQPESKPSAAKITKKQLMQIDGVGSATADKILELLK